MTFFDLGLSPETLKAVEDVGYNEPTPIQEQAIPHVLIGRDVLGIATTGTGKTASFTLPMIDVLAQGRTRARMPRSLILAPTRELANQVAENFSLYGKYHRLSMALLIGGESFSEQEKALDRGVDVLIATPGRLIDLFDRGRILLRDVKILVIDEVDRMLDIGFMPDVERIVSLLPPLRQTLFFSATMDAPIRKLADTFLSNPKEVRVAPTRQAAAKNVQHLVVVDECDKRESLRHILTMEQVRNAFIFCNRKRDVAIIYRSLKKHGFDVAQLHGDLPQQERTATLAQFKAGEVKLLVCSDVAARGIDIADVSHVFNFDVPTHGEDYVHRIGRTGRAGREGRAFTIATPSDTRYVGHIETLIGNAIPRLDLEGITTRQLSEDAPARTSRRAGADKPDKKRPSHRSTPKNGAKRDQSPPSDHTSRAAAPEGRQDSRRGRRNHPAWDVEEMEHGDDVVAFGTHTPAFMLVDMDDFSATEEALLSDEEADRLKDDSAPVVEDTDTPIKAQQTDTGQTDTGQTDTGQTDTGKASGNDGAADGAADGVAHPSQTLIQTDIAETTVAVRDVGIEHPPPAKPKRRRRKTSNSDATPADGNATVVPEGNATLVNAAPSDPPPEGTPQEETPQAEPVAVKAKRPRTPVAKRKTPRPRKKSLEPSSDPESTTGAPPTGDGETAAELGVVSPTRKTPADQIEGRKSPRKRATTAKLANDAAEDQTAIKKTPRSRKKPPRVPPLQQR